MQNLEGKFTFKELSKDHFDLLHRWLNEKHISTVWDGPQTLEQVQKKYSEHISSDVVFPYLVIFNDNPIGYIQSYHANRVGDGWWENEPEGTWGVDLYIGEKDFLGKGLGPKFIKEFSDKLLKKPEIKRVITDPVQDNLRAIKAYQKAGFNSLRPIKSLDGKCLLMARLSQPIIQSERTISRLATEEEISEVIEFHKTNDEKHFSPWNPELPVNFYEESFWEPRIKKSLEEFQADQSLRLFTYLKETNEMIATINFTTFERGPFQNCRLGYKIGKGFEGRGLMKESLQASIDYVFDYMQFHRVEANFIPENERSRRLLKRLGFEEAGISTNYLRINGKWQDHILSSLVNPNWIDDDGVNNGNS